MFLKKLRELSDTLFFRLTILYAAALIIISMVSFLSIYYRIRSVTMERMDQDLLEETFEFSDILNESGLESLQAKIFEEANAEDPEEEFYRLIDLKGNILASTDMSTWGNIAIDAVIKELQVKKNRHLYQTIDVVGADYGARKISAIIGNGVILQIGESFEEADEYLAIFRNLFAVLTIIMITLAAILGWLLARQALIDMKEVTQTAEEISKGSYSKRVQISGRLKEIKELAFTFNHMLDRVQNLLKSMKEINDNIAHDLRSPLARIRGIAEMTLTDEKSIQDYKDMAVSTMEECDILIDMINTMLDITEVEAGVNGGRPENFDLTVLIVDACELFRPMADEKKIDISINLPKTIAFWGDRKKMQRIVTNVLENAIKYTLAHGAVSVSAISENNGVQIVFKDSGIGISKADLPHIFERFYRCDSSRSLDGVGLGLSLAKAYSESMGGTISVNTTLNHGSTFILKFTHPPS